MLEEQIEQMFYFPVLCSGAASWPAHNGVCTAQTCLRAKAFLWAALEICVSTDFQDMGELAGRGLTLLETAKLSPQAKLLFFFLGQELPSYFVHREPGKLYSRE